MADTQSYYRDVLKFDVRDSAHTTCTAQKDDCTLIFTTADNVGAEPNFSGTIYCFIRDVDTYYDQVRDQVMIQWPLQDMAYGTREFGVKDINNYSLAFAQDRAEP